LLKAVTMLLITNFGVRCIVRRLKMKPLPPHACIDIINAHINAATVQAQWRPIATSTRNLSDNPFRVLGIPPNSSMETAQSAFIKLAIQHHPDTNEGDEKSVQNFVRIRQAFERIRDHSKNRAKDGTGSRKDDGDDSGYKHPPGSWTEDDFLQWFFEQTGMRLTSDQRQELVHLHRSRIPGGRYDGPSWELARRLAFEQDAFLHQRYQQQQRGHSFAASSNFSNSSGGDKKESSAQISIRRKRQK
jgi:curved DNA-binding protein CbpA